jgi:hypothetical protein
MDGTLDAEAVIGEGDKSFKVVLSGTWKVSEGVIIGTVTKTNVPDLIVEGFVTKDQVVSLDDKLLTYKTENGKENSRKRIKS